MTRRRRLLVWAGLAVFVGFLVLNTIVRLVTQTHEWKGLATIGGRIEPDDDLVPATDPAFAAGLHARYSLGIDQGAKDPHAFYLRFEVTPPIAHPSATALRSVACRVAHLLERPRWSLNPEALWIVDQIDPGEAAPPIQVKAAGCNSAS